VQQAPRCHRCAKQRSTYPSPTLPFATRKGGSRSGSAERCSAEAFPAVQQAPRCHRCTNQRSTYPSPTLLFATRKGGSRSGSAEPCSAEAVPVPSNCRSGVSREAGGRSDCRHAGSFKCAGFAAHAAPTKKHSRCRQVGDAFQRSIRCALQNVPPSARLLRRFTWTQP